MSFTPMKYTSFWPIKKQKKQQQTHTQKKHNDENLANSACLLSNMQDLEDGETCTTGLCGRGCTPQ